VRFHFQLPALSLFGADSDILSNRSSSLHHNPNRAAGLLLLVRGKVGRPIRQKRSKGLSPASHAGRTKYCQRYHAAHLDGFHLRQTTSKPIPIAAGSVSIIAKSFHGIWRSVTIS
jgi:hypothetical protein